MESVESVCNSLAKFKVVDVDQVRTLRARWREQAGNQVDQVTEFKNWLIKSGKVSGFQLDMLGKGFGDRLYLEDYRLFDRIGVGRNAGIYEAYHNSGQKVAIKVLPPTRAKNPQILGRFLREARLAIRLEHDNVIRTFHQGKDKEGMNFIVMEFLDGETLNEVVARRKRLPPAEAVQLAIQALQGLQHLDEKGLIHRDIKPANLIVVPGRVANEPDTTLKATLKILDIGLGRALFDEGDPAAGEAHDLTREGTLLGTMNYMAPEQARDAHAADIRADIYSLGCVLYELLAGHPPFTDGNMARQIRRHAEERPRPLMEAAPGTPEALDAIVQKMLAKDPALRYLTPGQAMKDLRSFLSSLGSEPSMPKPAKPLGTFLTWLETKRVDDDDSPPAPAANKPGSIPVPIPIPVPAPPQAPASAPISVPLPALAGAIDPGSTVPIPIPMPPPRPANTPTIAAPPPPRAATHTMITPAPPSPVTQVLTNPSPASMAAPAPAPVEKLATPVVKTATPAKPAVSAADPASVGTAGRELAHSFLGFVQKLFISLRRLSKRDWICIGSGALAMLIVTWIWALVRGLLGR